MECIRKEKFTVTNPFNRKSRTLAVTPDNVHTIVFWSKNFDPFIGLNAHRILTEKGFNLFLILLLIQKIRYLNPAFQI